MKAIPCSLAASGVSRARFICGHLLQLYAYTRDPKEPGSASPFKQCYSRTHAVQSRSMRSRTLLQKPRTRTFAQRTYDYVPRHTLFHSPNFLYFTYTFPHLRLSQSSVHVTSTAESCALTTGYRNSTALFAALATFSYRRPLHRLPLFRRRRPTRPASNQRNVALARGRTFSFLFCLPQTTFHTEDGRRRLTAVSSKSGFTRRG